MSFVFYDTETTGINTTFDQILQFAAIRTDENLNEVDRHEIRCRLDPHVVPSAGAFRVTGMTIDRVTDPGLPSHYEMICQIRDRLSTWCPATFVGWNTMRFDEQLLRQAFYKCLHPPYLTNTNGNQRSDILKLAQCVEAFAPGVLNVPQDARGKPVYKLDQLAPANGFPHLNAHDAMADVEATIFICRLIKDRAPHAWERLLHCASKARVQSVVRDNLIFVLSDSYFNQLHQFALTEIGDDPDGMGAGCRWGVMVDKTTGLVHALPLGGEENMYLDVQTQRGSNLLLATWQDGFGAEATCVREAYVWEGWTFTPLDGFPVRSGGQCS